MGFTKKAKQIAHDQQKNASKAALEDLFQDYYQGRKRIYAINMVRGMFFGFGSVLGGTILVALLLWILSVLYYVPFVDNVVETIQNSLQERAQ